MGWNLRGPVGGGTVAVVVALGAGCVDSPEPAVPLETLPAGEFSYAPYARVLYEYVHDNGLVDYAGLEKDRADLDAFTGDVARLDAAEFETWNEAGRIAFWTNAYNAFTLTAIIDHYPIEPSALRSVVYPKNSIRQIPGVWNKLRFTVMGKPMTLDQIEHEVLRGEFDEPRIHMALVCAAMSCPPLRDEPYDGERLDEQLTDQALRFLASRRNFRIDQDEQRVYLSSIFDWFGDDFVSKYGDADRFPKRSDSRRAVLEFVTRHVGEDDRAFLTRNQFSIEFLDYDWTLNERKIR